MSWDALRAEAVRKNASDVHIEPDKHCVRIRYRIDGMLYSAMEQLDRRYQEAVVSRIKIMAKLNIAERRLPQDGRIKIVARGKTVDLRVSIVPTMHGESIVLRFRATIDSHPDHAIAKAQMRGYGGLVSFELDHPVKAPERR